MLDTYRSVLSRPGGIAFSMSGLVGRLPISMVGLGIVLLVSTRTGSYSVAGSVSAAYVLANAACSVPQGRLIDRWGQDRFLPPAILGFVLSLALLMWSVQDDWPIALPHLFAGLAGAFLPPVGSCVRARWAHVLEPREIHTAYSFEAVIDEMVFVLGPTLVTLLATAWHPLAGLATAAVTGLVGTLALAAQRRTQPPGNPRRADGVARNGLPWPVLAPLALVCLMLGALFGSAEVATVAFTEEHGVKVWSGPLLAVMAFGSLLAGLISGTLHWRTPEGPRIQWGMLALTLLMAPMLVVGNLVVMGGVLFLAGFAVSPTLIATMSLAERLLPRARLTEGMAVLHTGLAGGIAVAAPISGVVVDRVDASMSYAVTIGSSLIGLALSLWLTSAARDADPS